MRVCTEVLCLVFLATCGACHTDGQSVRSGRVADAEAVVGKDAITGTVRYIDLEGGFYGIETDSGAKLDPVNLPDEFRNDGVRLRIQVVSVTDSVSFHMWGAQVRVVSIERL